MTVIDHTKAYLAEAENAIEQAIVRGTLLVQTEAKRLVNQHSSRPVPSAPGEPPHKDTGTLGRSIDRETFRRDGDFIGRIGTNLNYGRYLELGTRTLEPRPYLRPALDKMRPQILKEIKKAMGRVK